MSIDALRDALPAYAKDLSLNLSTLSNEATLTDQQKWGAFLACAYAIGEPTTVREIEDAAVLDDAARTAAKAAAAIMGMNNVYYRSIHLMKSGDYSTLPARLRMNILGAPGVDKTDFELWSLAVSAVNGCGMCLDAHDDELRKRGMPNTHIQTGLRIAAVVNAVAHVLLAETAARAGAPRAAEPVAA